MKKKIADELLSVLRAIRAESQGFIDNSEMTRARARAVLARAEGQVDGLAELKIKHINENIALALQKEKQKRS